MFRFGGEPDCQQRQEDRQRRVGPHTNHLYVQYTHRPVPCEYIRLSIPKAPQADVFIMRREMARWICMRHLATLKARTIPLCERYRSHLAACARWSACWAGCTGIMEEGCPLPISLFSIRHAVASHPRKFDAFGLFGLIALSIRMPSLTEAVIIGNCMVESMRWILRRRRLQVRSIDYALYVQIHTYA